MTLCTVLLSRYHKKHCTKSQMHYKIVQQNTTQLTIVVLNYPHRDRQLCMEAPGIKRSLEQLIFRMKTMVAGSDNKESTQVWVRT